jgi:hypothetical protein
MKFPHKCCRCGFCCLNVTCPIGAMRHGKDGLCPSLSFDGDKAICALIDVVPIGNGCCIAARAYKGGKCYDFASLPPQLKISVAQNERARKCQTTT